MNNLIYFKEKHENLFHFQSLIGKYLENENKAGNSTIESNSDLKIFNSLSKSDHEDDILDIVIGFIIIIGIIIIIVKNYKGKDINIDINEKDALLEENN